MTRCRTVLIEDVPASDDAFGPEGPMNGSLVQSPN